MFASRRPYATRARPLSASIGRNYAACDIIPTRLEEHLSSSGLRFTNYDPGAFCDETFAAPGEERSSKAFPTRFMLLLACALAAQGVARGQGQAVEPLSVAVVGNAPFVIKADPPIGLSVDVWETVAASLGVAYTLVPQEDRGGPHCLDSAAAELRWTLRFIVRLPKSVAGSPHRRRSG